MTLEAGGSTASDISDEMLTLDQALIWIATGRTDLVNSASVRVPVQKRQSWMMLWALTALAPSEPETENSDFSVEPEIELLRSLRISSAEGGISAWVDGVALHQTWLKTAELVNVPCFYNPETSSRLGFPNRMALRRRYDEPLLIAERDLNYLMRMSEDRSPTLPTNEVIRSFQRKPSQNKEEIGRRGRPMIYDWDGAKKHIFRVLDEHGAPFAGDKALSSQADLERRTAEYFRKNGRKQPAISGIRSHVANWLKQHKAEKAGK